jgi:hypothetical protein
MKEMADVLITADGPEAERLAAKRASSPGRIAVWNDIQEGDFPESYASVGGKKFVGAQRRTAIRCDFLMASKIALGRNYAGDLKSDLAQRHLLFSVLRDRGVFPGRTGSNFYCRRKYTAKLYEFVSARVFRYIGNEKWKADIETSRPRNGRKGDPRTGPRRTRR